MTFRPLLSLLLIVGAIGIAATCAERALKAADRELGQAQRSLDATQRQLAAARRQLATAQAERETAASTIAEARDSTVSTGDAAFDSEARELLRRVYALRKRIDHNPAAWIPEIRHARDSDWFSAVTFTSDWTDANLAIAAVQLRQRAQAVFLESVYHALDRYLDQNHGVLPKNVRELASYFAGSCDEESLARYEMVASGRVRDVPDDAPLMAEIMSASDREDATTTGYENMRVRIRGEKRTPESRAERRLGDEIFEAIEKYQKQHAGDWPAETKDLLPYMADPSVLEGVKMIEHGFSRQVAEPPATTK